MARLFQRIGVFVPAFIFVRNLLGVDGQAIKIGYQTDLSGLAHRIALLKDYYTDLGLEVEMIWYESGDEQIKDAVEENAWDFGTAGVMSNILGGQRGLIGVGIAMDQSATHQLVGNPVAVDQWPIDSLQGVSIAVNSNSPADYVLQACLKSYGYSIGDGEWTDVAQDEVMTTMGSRSTQVALGGMGSRHVVEFLMDEDWGQTLCTGASVHASVTSGHMARKEFAERNPLAVAKVLSGWLRAVHFMHNSTNKEEVLDIMEVFYEEHNVVLPRSYLDLESRLVGLFKLPYQLDLMARGGELGISNYDFWTDQVANFMVENGIASELQNSTTFIDSRYMRMVEEYAGLRDWALGEEIPGLTNLNATSNTESPAELDGPVRIAYQTDVSGLAHRIAISEGYYSDLGLDIEMVWYESDDAQITAATEEAAWDFGSIGAIFHVLGALQDLVGVGIAMDLSATTQLLGNSQGVSLWPPESSSGLSIVVPANSSAEYVADSCLKAQGYDTSNIGYKYNRLQGCVEALQPGINGSSQANLGAVTAPYIYEILETIEGSETVCTGAFVDAMAATGHMARKAFAEQRPRAMAKILAGWLRAVTFINHQANIREVVDIMSSLIEEHNITTPRSYLEFDLRLVGLYGLQQQLDLMERPAESEASNYDIWTDKVGSFMLESGIIAEIPNATSFIDDYYMRLVDDDTDLRSWALGEEIYVAPPSLPQQVLFRADLSMFADFWEKADMPNNPILRELQPFTLFVPNNQAFLKMDGRLLSLMNSPAGQDMLTAILLQHASVGFVTVSQTVKEGSSSLLMLSGEALPLNDSPLTMDGALILAEGTGEGMGDDGLYHVIDKVLLPLAALKWIESAAHLENIFNQEEDGSPDQSGTDNGDSLSTASSPTGPSAGLSNTEAPMNSSSQSSATKDTSRAGQIRSTAPFHAIIASAAAVLVAAV